MRRTWWMKQVGLCFEVMMATAMLTRVAWADPVGTANVPQILNALTFHGTSEQRTFRTTDVNIDFVATYYDDKAACVAVPPVLIQLFGFNSEGVLVLQVNLTGEGPAPGSHYTFANVGLAPANFGGPGTYSYSYLIRDCTNAISVVLTPFGSFRIVAP